MVYEAEILSRVIRAVPEGWEYECYQAEIVLEELQSVGCNPLGIPGVEDVLKRTLGQGCLWLGAT